MFFSRQSSVISFRLLNINFVDLSYLKAVQKLEQQLPLDVIIECFVSLSLSMLGITMISQPFNDIRLESEAHLKRIESFDSSPSFAIFEHKGKVLSSLRVPVSS
ncbi:hypothetical protein DSO57_1013586 [Entomophthora muscae]|uniref:Uncharacterized protein n=1 Tax=Entomophthora muscae TaxID=34485 RepID=A0ACC2S7T5_9FUNG|nr:hypothetical protein DSO57_1013586 [Entomophthora muscae]